MPLYQIESVEDRPQSAPSSPVDGKPAAAPTIDKSTRYAKDARHAIQELSEEHRRTLSIRPLRGVRNRRETHIEEKREIYHRLTQAMTHRSYNLAETAKRLIPYFDKNKRSHKNAKSFLDACCHRKLGRAMAMHPQMFSESEIEAMLVSQNERETLAMLYRTTGDQYKMAKDLGTVLAMPIVNVITLIGAVLFMLVMVIPSIVKNIFPYATTIPPFLQWMVAASDALHDTKKLLIIFVVLTALIFGWLITYRYSPRVRLVLALLVMHQTRAYGRLKHAIERRSVFNSMIHLLHAGKIKEVFARASKIAGPAGEAALLAADSATQVGQNPMTRIRAAEPFINVQEGEAIISGYAESGVSGTVLELQHCNENIDDEMPRISDAMKREINIASTVAFASTLAFFFLGLSNAVINIVLHLRPAYAH